MLSGEVVQIEDYPRLRVEIFEQLSATALSP